MDAPNRPAPSDMLTAALAWCAAGCSVVRVTSDGTKRPEGTWADAQRVPADADTVTRWFQHGHPGLGIVCGAVSGGLEMLELEGRAVEDGIAERFWSALDECGLTDVRTRLANGYTESSPSGGLHFVYRVTGRPVPGNTKLAQRVNPDPAGTPKRWPLLETRGEGGFVVVAPSWGPTHPTQRPWQRLHGSPALMATLTADEHAAFHDIARTFDECPPPEPIPDPVPLDTANGVRPGDDFTARATWDEILVPAGWTPVTRSSGRTLWRRPGKHIGVSAATGGPAGDFLWVWSTSTELPAEQGLSKFRAYTLLRHAGDFSASAKALAAAGYGTRTTPEQPRRPVLTPLAGYGALAPAIVSAATVTRARTDDAVAIALVDTYGAGIRYCADRGRWLTWSGHRWLWCDAGAGSIREHVKALARALPEQDNTDVRFKTHCLSAPGTTAIVHQAASDPRVVVQLAELDARPFELCTPGGIVDLATGKLGPSDPAHLHTRSATVAPDSAADPGLWTWFLQDTFAGHDDIPGYLQRLVGYSATGAVSDHVLPFCYGQGENGKSVFLETVAKVLGDYATSTAPGFLMARRHVEHATELADLAGKRFVICSELNERDKFDEARVKLLTGGDEVKARFMRQDYFTFTPTHHLWIMGNHQPTVGAGGAAFWRRLRIIPFANRVQPDKKIDRLSDLLARDHGPAVLAWIVAGSIDYLAHGLQEPDSVHAATDDYEHDQDSIGRFVEDCCHIGGGDNVTTTISVVRAAYERWCASESLTPVGARTFSLALRDRFKITYTTAGRSPRRYVGLALVPELCSDMFPETRKDLM